MLQMDGAEFSCSIPTLIRDFEALFKQQQHEYWVMQQEGLEQHRLAVEAVKKKQVEEYSEARS